MKLSTIIKAGSKLVYSLISGRRVPLIAGWAITNRCNLRCEYCQWPEKTGSELTTSQALDLVDQMARAGTIHCVFSGGEPLMRDDLEQIFGQCRRRGITISIDSNGLLAKKRLSVLKQIQLLQLSLDGPQEVNDISRGKGCFEAVIEAVELCRANHIPISFNTTLTRHNIDQVDWIVDYATQVGARVDFQPVSDVHASSEKIEVLLPGREDYSKAIKKIIERKRQGAPISNSFPA